MRSAYISSFLKNSVPYTPHLTPALDSVIIEQNIL